MPACVPLAPSARRTPVVARPGGGAVVAQPAELPTLRRPVTGNLPLYALDQEAGHINAFKVAEVSGVTAGLPPREE